MPRSGAIGGLTDSELEEPPQKRRRSNDTLSSQPSKQTVDESAEPPLKRRRSNDTLSSQPSRQTVIEDLSGSDAEDPPPLPAKVRKAAKRRPTLEQRRAKCTNVQALELLVQKPCYKRCRKSCHKQFQCRENFEQLVKFRKDWSMVHKVDQDETVPRHFSENLVVKRGAGFSRLRELLRPMFK